jgi:hypothetical protein
MMSATAVSGISRSSLLRATFVSARSSAGLYVADIRARRMSNATPETVYGNEHLVLLSSALSSCSLSCHSAAQGRSEGDHELCWYWARLISE